jgi:hypothetical protein
METSHLQPTNGQRLVIGLASYDSSGHAAPPTTPGAFPVQQNSPGAANSNTAEVYYDAGCMKLDPHAGVAGLVQVTSIQQDGTLEGTFDFFLGCGGFSTCSGPAARVTGSFHAAVCSGFSVNSTPACG